ncbi:hypothetical protein F4825DRAFT_449218 [Nemania diffusa]|nr:hypothetical protein F4825DRAFT_449218 [Nemania diffusa]
MTIGLDTRAGTIAFWCCNGFMSCLIFARLALGKCITGGLDRGAWGLVVAFVFNGLRMASDYYTKYGTPLGVSTLLASMPEDEAGTPDLTTQEQNNLILAGKLMIVARLFIVVVLWSLKMVVLDLLSPLLREVRCHCRVLWWTFSVVAFAFVAAVLSIFLECQIGNIVTDTIMFLLFVLLVVRARIPKRGKARLSIFALRAILIGIEIFRLVDGLPYAGVLLHRIVWGSVEVAVATSVATIPGIYILLQLRFKERQEKPTPIEIGAEDIIRSAEDMISKLVPQGSSALLITTVSAGVGNPESQPESTQLPPQSLQSPGPCSEASHQPAPPFGWIELEEEAHTSARVRVAVSPQPDDTGSGSGILVATEINQQVHRIKGPEQRPRLVTIPPRAREDRSEE